MAAVEILTGRRFLTAEAASLRGGGADAAAGVESTCDRIDAVEPVIEAFVPEPDRRGRLRAEVGAVVRRWPEPADRPALFGIPFGVKDIVRTDGLPTRGGSALPAELFAGPALGGGQAAAVDRLTAAGAVLAGKTVTAEFAILAPGPTRNPVDPRHSPGGSSSGSAAAVAAGAVPLALGTQTVGSMIRPAAYCGVVGFKPTFGRIPVDGVIPNVPSLDTLGFFTADVAGARLAATVLCDDWRPTAAGGPAESALPVLGIPTGPYLDRAGAEARDAFAEHVRVLRSAGFAVREVPVMSDFDQVEQQLFTLNRYEAAQTHADWFSRYGELYREETVAVIRKGQGIDRADYLRSVQYQQDFRDRMALATASSGIDLWLTPAASTPAPLGLSTTGSSIMCLPWSFAGMPSLAVPAGASSAGLPLGLQCVGQRGGDEQVLAWSLPIEAAFQQAD